MPLTATEINAINEIVNSRPRISGKQLVSLLEDNFTESTSEKTKLGDAYKRGRGEEVHVIYRGEQSPVVDPTRQRERKDGFKLRTKSESAQADSQRKK